MGGSAFKLDVSRLPTICHLSQKSDDSKRFCSEMCEGKWPKRRKSSADRSLWTPCTFNCTAIDKLNGTASVAQRQSTDIRRPQLRANPSPRRRTGRSSPPRSQRPASYVQHPKSKNWKSNSQRPANNKQQTTSKIQNPKSKTQIKPLRVRRGCQSANRSLFGAYQETIIHRNLTKIVKLKKPRKTTTETPKKSSKYSKRKNCW